MNKKLLAIAILGSFGVAAHAQSSVTLYGVIDAGVSYVNHSKNAAGGSDKLFKYDDGVAQGSRWGLRGSEDLGGGLKAIFLLENGFNSGNGTLGQGSREFGRQAYVGLAKDNVGSLTLGRQYTFSTDILGNYSTGGQTVAGNYAYHINDLDQLTSSRIDNAVKFTSANYSGLTFGALYGFSNQAGAFTGSPGTSGSSSAYSFGVNYAAGPFGVGAAYTDIRFPSATSSALPSATASTAIAGVSVPGTIHDLRTFGFGGRYSLGAATMWALYTNTRFVPITGTETTFDAYEIGGKYAFTTALTAGLGYTYMHAGDAVKGHWNQLDASVDYALSKRTDVYLLGIYQRAAGQNGATPVQAQIGSSATAYFGQSGNGSNNQLALRVGLRHKF